MEITNFDVLTSDSPWWNNTVVVCLFVHFLLTRAEL